MLHATKHIISVEMTNKLLNLTNHTITEYCTFAHCTLHPHFSEVCGGVRRRPLHKNDRPQAKLLVSDVSISFPTCITPLNDSSITYLSFSIRLTPLPSLPGEVLHRFTRPE